MADKKLNQVSQLTDFDYALVVKGNDVATVTKQQLATILGGPLPVASENNNGLMSAYYSQSITRMTGVS